MLSRKNEEAKNPIILLQNRFQFFVFLQFSLRGNCIRFIFCSHMFFIPQDVYNLFALVYTFFWINFLTLLFPSEIPASSEGMVKTFQAAMTDTWELFDHISLLQNIFLISAKLNFHQPLVCSTVRDI